LLKKSQLSRFEEQISIGIHQDSKLKQELSLVESSHYQLSAKMKTIGMTISALSINLHV
jgi:uncharacterized Rmd1/YagE family protein